MTSFHNILKSKVFEWRIGNYPSRFSVISEIFDFNFDTGTENLRFLRKAQFEALETYWYLRLVEKTPHIFELYKRLYPDSIGLLKALGIPTESQEILKLPEKKSWPKKEKS